MRRFLALAVLLLVLAQIQAELSKAVIERVVREAKSNVDANFLQSRRETLARVRRSSVSSADALAFIKAPRGLTRQATRCAEYFNAAVDQLYKMNQVGKRRRRRSASNDTTELTTEDLEHVAMESGCSMLNVAPKCSTLKNLNTFRTADSTCNNLENPLWGSSNIKFVRWLDAEYQDNKGLPKGFGDSLVNGHPLPLVRNVSNHILATGNDTDDDNFLSALVTFFAQWTDHDLTLTPHTPVSCETCEQKGACFPIPVPGDDSRLSQDQCIPFVRSAPACTGHGKPMREQLNALTAYLDVGQVYGATEKQAEGLRDLDSDGLLRINEEYDDNDRDLLPFIEMEMNMCATKGRITGQNVTEIPCFEAGDERVDENIALTSLHTLFLREHNRLAKELKRLNPHWDGERIYQEARKILGAVSQIITIRDWLPLIVGPAAMRVHLSQYPGYSDSTDASISNIFATAAFRFAHLMVQMQVFRLNEDYDEHPDYPSPLLHRAFFTPWRITHEGGIDPIVRGMIGRQAKLNTQDKMMHDQLRLLLFFFLEQVPLDLASLNLQRGRDHGLPGYNAWRKHCGLSQPQNEDELAEVLNNRDLARSLLEQYGTPDNIDAWLGGVAEPFVHGGRVGPLFACLIADQFRMIQKGDRFWWQNDGVFTEKQKKVLRMSSISNIICENTGITAVPRNPFQISPGAKRYVPCSEIPELDLWAWKERDDGEKPGTPGSRGPPGPQGPRGPPGPPGTFVQAPLVAFSARLGNNYPKEHQPIAFHEPLVNEPGHYCTETGVFTTVIPGVYEFHMTLLIYNANVGVDLMCNRVILLHTFNTKHNGYIMASGSIIVRLKKGDRVYLVINEGSNSLLKDSVFVGNLLHADDPSSGKPDNRM